MGQTYGIYDEDDLIEDGFRGDYGHVAAAATAADYAADPTNEGRTFEVKPIDEEDQE